MRALLTKIRKIFGTPDLKLRLIARFVALSGVCFVSASAYVLFETDRVAQAKADWIAQIVAQDLQLQRDRNSWGNFAFTLFPDLQTVGAPLMMPGLCIAYRTKSGEIVQRICNGTPDYENDAPAFFAAAYRLVFDPGRAVARPVLFRNVHEGDAVVAVDAGRVISQAWYETSWLLAVMATTLLCLCILVYGVLTRALRPTRQISAALEKLAANDLSTRLPPFDLAELSAIGDVFNHLAESLDRTLAERNALTRKLIAVQDEERRNLARELHDEFGQSLAAISALAASAGQTAREVCPSIWPECQSIGRTSAQMMETLRGALVRLRPPDVDELGLAASLEALVAGWNSRSRGRTRYEIALCGSFDALPAAFGASLYRIAQEAITNAAKHADATKVGLRLSIRPGAVEQGMASRKQELQTLQGAAIELVIVDDGAARTADLSSGAGMGLLGMRERVASLGGHLSFEVRQPNGLLLRAVIPAPADTVKREVECAA